MRIGKRRNKKPVRPKCPEHGRQMLVRCVIGRVQYRYCPVPECGESVQTVRKKQSRRRQRRKEASPAAAETQLPEQLIEKAKP